MGSHLTCAAQNVIACEPTLSNKYKASHYSPCDMESECHSRLTKQEAHNFYKGLVEKTEYVLHTVSLQHSYNCLARGKIRSPRRCGAVPGHHHWMCVEMHWTPRAFAPSLRTGETFAKERSAKYQDEREHTSYPALASRRVSLPSVRREHIS